MELYEITLFPAVLSVWFVAAVFLSAALFPRSFLGRRLLAKAKGDLDRQNRWRRGFAVSAAGQVLFGLFMLGKELLPFKEWLRPYMDPYQAINLIYLIGLIPVGLLFAAAWGMRDKA